MAERRSRTFLPAALGLLALLPGCGAPPATMDLIAVARGALDEAAAAETAHHARMLSDLQERRAALDAAFDADARLSEAGGIRDEAGRPVALSAEWVIAARKGYAAARDALSEQARQASAAHATRLDNLAAGAEALDLAEELIVLQSSLAARARAALLSLQRRLPHAR